MRIASWNINNVVRRLDLLVDWLHRTKPQVVALQELKATTEAFPVEALRDAGYSCVVHGQRTWNGVALLARGRPITKVADALPGDAADRQARYLEAAIDGVLYCCIYLPNGNPRPGPKFDYKLAWFERLRKRTSKLWASGEPVVLLGDWNVVPTDADIYRPDTWREDALMQPETRKAFSRVLKQGWTDAIRATHRGQVPFTYWDYRRKRWERDAGLRIDHILLSPHIQIVDAGVDRDERGRENASDHAPVWAEIELRPADSRPLEHARDDIDTMPRVALPESLEPQLATLADAPPSGDNWLAETKYDGYRLLARIEDDRVRLFTRNGKDWTARLRTVSKAVKELGVDRAWLDGEIVVMNDRGIPDFNRLQNAIDSGRSSEIVYFLFDLPFLDGRDLRALPFSERRALLEGLPLNGSGDRVRISQTFDAPASHLLEAACQIGLEGVMLKRPDASYVSGRTRTWLKLKCSHRQEFVVVGFVQRANAPGEIGSLLLAYHDDEGQLRYAGAVGTGWSSAMARELHTKLEKLEVAKAPVDPDSATPGRWSRRKAADQHWVRPKIVVEVAFAEWTPDGSVRHATFRGIRSDKPPKEIRRDDPSAGTRKQAPAVNAQAPAVHARAPAVHVTHPERVIDPSSGTTKIELVRYYESIADWLLPHLKDRPVSLVRAPQGIASSLFFQKHSEASIPGITELDAQLWPGHAPLLVVNSTQALLSAVQLNTIEFHTWNSSSAHIDQPDRIVFDLDPGEGIEWPQLREAATLVRGFVAELGLLCWLKTSGGKGLHLVVPLAPRDDYESVKAFSRSVVEHIAKVIPQRFVAKSGGRNRKGKIYIDYLRNGQGQTTVAAFSARARPGMGVSMPVHWDELDALQGGAHWTIATARSHVEGWSSDPWSDYAKHRQSLDRARSAIPTQAR